MNDRIVPDPSTDVNNDGLVQPMATPPLDVDEDDDDECDNHLDKPSPTSNSNVFSRLMHSEPHLALNVRGWLVLAE